MKELRAIIRAAIDKAITLEAIDGYDLENVIETLYKVLKEMDIKND